MNLFTTNNPPFPAGLNILAVDHDIHLLNAIHCICNRLHYQLTTCCTLSHALDHLFRQQFDIVLVKTHIPYQDTYAFVQQVTSLFKIPVIMMSTDNQPSSVMNSILSGACAYWSKPLDQNLFKNMWQHVVPKDFIKTRDGHELEAKGLKKRARDDAADVSKQPPLAKKTRLSWTKTPHLHQKFLSAVNRLGIDNAVPKKVLKMMDSPGLTLGHVSSHLQKYREYLKGGIKNSKLKRFDFQALKNNVTQSSMTEQDQRPDKSNAEQHPTEIDEPDVFFDLTDFYPDLDDDIHNVMS